MDHAAANDWPAYFKAVTGKGPRETLAKALEMFAKELPPDAPPRLAVDLACGEGRDTLELLARGWRVIALDGHPEGLAHLRQQVRPELAPRLERAEVATFADARWPECDLLNCSYALPFCTPDLLPDLWTRIVRSIRPGGRFAGQIFGDRDSWGRCGRTLGISRRETERMFERFTFDQFFEDEKDDVTTLGEPKHWHVFHIVARKRTD